METLPMPIPDMDTDVLASFTYRAQKSHRDALAFQLEDSGIGKPDVLVDDSVLESTLADTVHSGYFEGIGGKDEQFDSIVLDEVLNVPWPFYEIDLDEPIVENEYNELDPEEIVGGNSIEKIWKAIQDLGGKITFKSPKHSLMFKNIDMTFTSTPDGKVQYSVKVP